MTYAVIDLFAGPGGLDEGMRILGREDVAGVEIEESACATARAAGHARFQADVSALDPRAWTKASTVAPDGVEGLLASPPCQGFSRAGKGQGVGDTPHVLEAVSLIAAGFDVDVVLACLASQCKDHRTALVLEPLRWALALEPEWTCWEQVPTVLPLWEACAAILRAAGYNVWTGNLQAERYGVPQTRRRAVLVASRTRQVSEPIPTHSRFYGKAPERMDIGVLPWVSMAEALGWSPSELVGFPRRADEQDSVILDGVAYRARDLRPAAYPSFALTEKARSWARWMPSAMGDVRRANGTVRTIDQPAPTLTSAMDNGNFQWVYRNGNQAHSARRPLEHPAPTVHFGARANKVEWIEEHRAADLAASGRRVTVQEAAVLQSFTADYPWQGTRTAQYLQVGNAVPPMLAARVAAVAMGATPVEEAAA